MASFTKKVNRRLAKRPLVFNGRLANRGLTSLVKEATVTTKICMALWRHMASATVAQHLTGLWRQQCNDVTRGYGISARPILHTVYDFIIGIVWNLSRWCHLRFCTCLDSTDFRSWIVQNFVVIWWLITKLHQKNDKDNTCPIINHFSWTRKHFCWNLRQRAYKPFMKWNPEPIRNFRPGENVLS